MNAPHGRAEPMSADRAGAARRGCGEEHDGPCPFDVDVCERDGHEPSAGLRHDLRRLALVADCLRCGAVLVLHPDEKATGSGRVGDVPSPDLPGLQPLADGACPDESGTATRDSAELGKSRPIGPETIG